MVLLVLNARWDGSNPMSAIEDLPPSFFLDRHAGLPPLRGTPEVVAERLKQVQEAGINHVFGNFGFAGLPHSKVMRSIELFATEVMPHFQDAPVAASAG